MDERIHQFLFAILNSDLELAKQQVSLGVRVDVKNEHGWTALHIAAKKGNLSVLGWLLSIGACKYARTPAGLLPSTIARVNKQFFAARKIMLFSHDHSVAIEHYLKINRFASNKTTELPAGYRLVPLELHPIWDIQAGLKPCLVVNDRLGVCVLAFPATDSSNKRHLLADADLWSHNYLAVFSMLKRFAKLYQIVLKNLVLDYSLTVTGFSLGGALAAIFAARFKLTAYVFDTPGFAKTLADDSIRHKYVPDTSRITTYLAAPSPINTSQNHLGKIYRLLLPHQNVSQSAFLACLKCINKLSLPTFVYKVWVLSKLHQAYIQEAWRWIRAGSSTTTSWLNMQHNLVSMLTLVDPVTKNFRHESCILMRSWPLKQQLLKMGEQPNFKSRLAQVLSEHEASPSLVLEEMYKVISGYRMIH